MMIGQISEEQKQVNATREELARCLSPLCNDDYVQIETLLNAIERFINAKLTVRDLI